MKELPIKIGPAKKKIIFAFLLSFLLFAVIFFLSDIRAVLLVIQSFDLKFLPLIFCLAPLNYCLRFVKWEYFRKKINIDIDQKESAAIFLAGLSMTVTPAKVGEVLKAWLLKKRYDVKLEKGISLVAAERFTDAVSMLILAAAGAAVSGYGREILFLVALILLGAGFLFKNTYLLPKVISIMSQVTFLKRFSETAAGFHKSMQLLLDLKSFLYATALGVVSWSLEGVIIFLAFKALGVEFPLFLSVMVVSFSALVGAVSMLPGGLGAAEGSIFALLLLFGISPAHAAPVTLLTRISTLWLGVALGSFWLLGSEK